MNARRMWIIGGVVVAVAVVALGWFVAISPLVQQAREADQQTAASQQQLDAAELQLSGLQKEYRDIDQLQAQLDQLTQSVPATGEVSEFVRQLSSAAQAAGVTISSINPGAPTAYSPPPTASPVSTPAPGSTATDAATPAPSATATAQAPSNAAITSQNFFQLPVSLTAAGPRAKLLDFIHALQSGDQRLFTISSASVQAGAGTGTATGAGTGDAAGGSTATLTGDVYVLLPVK